MDDRPLTEAQVSVDEASGEVDALQSLVRSVRDEVTNSGLLGIADDTPGG